MTSFQLNHGSFEYTALQLAPDCTYPRADHSTAWTFERRDGFKLAWFPDNEKWRVSWKVDGIDVSMDIHPANVIAVTVGPKLDTDNDDSSRDKSRAGAA